VNVPVVFVFADKRPPKQHLRKEAAWIEEEARLDSRYAPPRVK
jgi:hypothetical protein